MQLKISSVALGLVSIWLVSSGLYYGDWRSGFGVVLGMTAMIFWAAHSAPMIDTTKQEFMPTVRTPRAFMRGPAVQEITQKHA